MSGLQFKHRQDLSKVLWFANILFALVLTLALWFSHAQHLQYAQERASNTTLTLERGLSGMLDQIDMLLIAVQDEIESELMQGKIEPKKVDALIARLARNVVGLNAVRYANAMGHADAHTGFPKGNPANEFPDRDYFQYLRDRPDVGMVHSKPLVGRSSGKPGIVFARAYRNPGGAFAGVVLLSIDLGRFSDMFADLKLGERANVVFVSDKDYVMLARHPAPPDWRQLGKPIPLQSTIDLLAKSSGFVAFTNRSGVDGVERIQAVRKLNDRPYWISVGLSFDEALAPWRKQVAAAFLVLLIFGGMSVVAGNQLQRGWRRQEEALSVLGATLDASDNGIFVEDQSSKVLHVNKRFVEMWRLSEDAAKGEQSFRMLQMSNQLADPQTLSRGFEAILVDREASFSDTLVFVDGRVFERSTVPMFLNGRPTGRVWSFRDITERKNMEMLLRQERDRAQTYLDTVEAIIVGLDCVGNIVRVNRKGCQILGWQEHELLGRSWFAMCLPQPNGMEQVHPYFLEMISGTESFSEYFENEIVTRSGERRFIAWHNAVLYNDFAQIIGVLSAGEDITERKQREAEIANYQDSLELLVNVRTEELAVSKEKAEASNRAKSVFLANMSHELRTPLNAILGFARLLERKDGLDTESAQQLATINRSGKHLLALINDVLEISRIEAGGTDIKMTAFDLFELLGEVAEMVGQRAKDKGLQFEVERSPLLPNIVMGDAQHLKQVLINLLGNAVKYTDRGRVGLRAAPVNGHIVFDVSDTGPGITVEEQSKLFKAFYQTDSGIAKGEGTGLGLAISFELTRLMGGSLAVQSELGEGSVFSVNISLPAADTPAPKGKQLPGIAIGLAPESGVPRVLVVDDKADNREMIEQLLRSIGFQVQVAKNGQEAVAAFVAFAPQFIWMDMRMPVMDGFAATRQIRTLPGGTEVKIVALTASAFEEDRREIKDAGCDDLVSKPVDEDGLLETMANLLGLRYRYADAAPAKQVLDTEPVSLSGLPGALIQQLQSAANALDMEKVRGTILQLGAIRPDVQNVLNAMLVEFRFDRISDLCEKA